MLNHAARIFASHYQLAICDDPTAFDEESNWRSGDEKRGFAGHQRFRMVGTVADLNDHWVEAQLSSAPPDPAPWHRITCVGLTCTTGQVHIMSIMDSATRITLEVPRGEYSVYVAACNLGVDQERLGDTHTLTDDELARRKDLEWYRIFLVPGKPALQGRLKDE
jgi:hypothetical protein